MEKKEGFSLEKSFGAAIRQGLGGSAEIVESLVGPKADSLIAFGQELRREAAAHIFRRGILRR